MTTLRGMSRRPSPRKSLGRFTYIRAEAERICPQARRRGIRSGATGVHVARAIAKAARPRIAARTSNVRPGLRRSWMSPFEPLATALQKKSVVEVPKSPATGTA
jgi:hypothetical protein